MSIMENDLVSVYGSKNQEKEHKRYELYPNSKFGGLNVSASDRFESAAVRANKAMNNTEEGFYKERETEQNNDLRHINKVNKCDHVKKMFGTLGFKAEGTTYGRFFEFDKEKERETNKISYENHYMKNEIMEYEETKAKCGSVLLRK